MDSEAKNTESDRPKKWWQWFMLYPALGVAMLGAIPTYIELYQSTKYDVEFGESKKAVQQNELWRKNLTCASAPFDPLVTASNIQVDATVCESGDVLVRIMAPTDKKFFEWVAVDNLLTQQLVSFNLFNSAIADEPETQLNDERNGPVVLCQRWLNKNKLLRRVSIVGRGCFDEVVNTYSGRVVKVTPAPCRCN